MFEARKIKFGNTLKLKENEKVVENPVEELPDNFEKIQNKATLLLGGNDLGQENTWTEIKVEQNV